MRPGALLTAALLVAALGASCDDAPPANDIAPDRDPVLDTPPAPDRPVPDEPREPEPPSPPESAEQPSPPGQPAEPWITHQPRVEELRRRTPAEMGWSPGTTEWGPARRAVPERLTEAYVRAHGGPGSPGDAMAVLARAVHVLDELHVEGWQEVTVRARQEAEDRATGVLLYWGALDDSLAGSDLRAVLRPLDGSWYIESLEERFHCRRGVTDGLCV